VDCRHAIGGGGLEPFICEVADPASVATRFGMRDCRPRDGESHSDLLLGRWSRDRAGRIQLGALTPAVDHVLGESIFVHRPASWWAVTTELSIDFLGPVEVGAGLHVHRIARQLGANGGDSPIALGIDRGYAQGSVVDARGKAVAVASARLRYRPAPRGWTESQRVYSRPEWTVATDAESIDDFLGLDLNNDDNGVTVYLADPSSWVNEFGIVHGGAWTCMAELAGSRAIAAHNPALMTAPLHTAFLRPVTGTDALSVTGRSTTSDRLLRSPRYRAEPPTVCCAPCQQ
jgi:acyl-coenzyme A thioesterase PaaI-like protein